MGKIELDERYQTECYEQVENDFQEGDRSCIVLPCGCGKTYIALKMIEEHSDEKILYASPSAVINVQIQKRMEEIYGMEWKKKFPNLSFTTYNALAKQSKRKEIPSNYARIVLDELHRTGAEVWGRGVQELLGKNQGAKVLGMTATPIRTDGKDMSVEICGGISYELPLTEAIARGVLPVPEYICTDYITEEDIARVEKEIEETYIGEKEELRKKIEDIRRHIEQADGIDKIFGDNIIKHNGKVLVFCRHIEDIERKADEMQRWFSKVNDKITISKISSANEREENDEEIAFFRESDDED